MALMKDVGVELKTRLVNLYDAAIVTAVALVEKNFARTAEREIDLCQAGVAIRTWVESAPDVDPYIPTTEEIQLVGINDEGSFYLATCQVDNELVVDGEYNSESVGNVIVGDSYIYNREELAETFSIETLVELVAALERIVK